MYSAIELLWTVTPEYGFWRPKLKQTTVSVQSTCWEGEQFPSKRHSVGSKIPIRQNIETATCVQTKYIKEEYRTENNQTNIEPKYLNGEIVRVRHRSRLAWSLSTPLGKSNHTRRRRTAYSSLRHPAAGLLIRCRRWISEDNYLSRSAGIKHYTAG